MINSTIMFVLILVLTLVCNYAADRLKEIKSENERLSILAYDYIYLKNKELANQFLLLTKDNEFSDEDLREIRNFSSKTINKISVKPLS